MNKFMDYLEDKRKLKCFELPDGTTMSYDDLVKYFEEEIHPTLTADAPANETPSDDNVGTEEMEEINGEENQNNEGNG